jgi:hypothetical protein
MNGRSDYDMPFMQRTPRMYQSLNSVYLILEVTANFLKTPRDGMSYSSVHEGRVIPRTVLRHVRWEIYQTVQSKCVRYACSVIWHGEYVAHLMTSLVLAVTAKLYVRKFNIPNLKATPGL